MENLIKEFDNIYNNKIQHYENTADIIRGYYNNEFSCLNGCISDLIYYYQTLKLYKKHSIAILEFLQLNDYEININETLSIENHINNLVWISFEIYTANKINELERENE